MHAFLSGLSLRPSSHADGIARRLLAALLAFAACTGSAASGEPIQPIPLASRQDPARAEIGRLLFADRRLSRNGTVSCASCHDLTKGGADDRAQSVGFDGKATEFNSPTVLNASLNFSQFWNGRVDSLEAQVDEVVRSPVEMGAAWADVVRTVAADPGYRTAFAAAYPDGVSKANIQNAIATFERTLTTPNSRFDRYLRGEAGAISAAEKAGYETFKRSGCSACHQGVNVGGNMFQKFGVLRGPAGQGAAVNPGRFAVTGLEIDRHVFKVPGLRNVALTAPYFHDASAKTLDEAVDVMFRYQLGRIPSAEDRGSIVLFLRTLTGEPGSRP